METTLKQLLPPVIIIAVVIVFVVFFNSDIFKGFVNKFMDNTMNKAMKQTDNEASWGNQGIGQ